MIAKDVGHGDGGAEEQTICVNCVEAQIGQSGARLRCRAVREMERGVQQAPELRTLEQLLVRSSLRGVAEKQ